MYAAQGNFLGSLVPLYLDFFRHKHLLKYHNFVFKMDSIKQVTFLFKSQRKGTILKNIKNKNTG